MNTQIFEFSSDDIFILGNIALMSQSDDAGKIIPIAKMIQQQRPKNAGGVIIETMFNFKHGKIKEALSVIENSQVFEANECLDEALAIHVYLLYVDDQVEEARELAAAYLAEGLIVKGSSAYDTLETVLNQA